MRGSLLGLPALPSLILVLLLLLCGRFPCWVLT
jgi:hypothetical protein